MYPTNGSTLRGDINIKVEEAAHADKFFIADRVLPVFSVPMKSGQYPKLQIAAAELMTPGSVNRAPDGSYGEVSRAWTYDSYDTVDRGLEERVDDSDQKDLSRFFNLEVTAARLVLRNMRLAAEVRAAAAIMNASTFADYTSPSVNYTYSLIATMNFALDVQAAIDRIEANGGVANTIVMSRAVANLIRRSTLMNSFVVGTVGPGSQTNPSTIQAAFADYGITNVLIGGASYNAGKKGQTKSMSPVWGNTYVWVGQVNSGASALEQGGAGFQLVWTAEGGQYVTESYRDESRRSNMIRVRQHSIEKIVDAGAGTLITTNYAAS